MSRAATSCAPRLTNESTGRAARHLYDKSIDEPRGHELRGSAVHPPNDRRVLNRRAAAHVLGHVLLVLPQARPVPVPSSVLFLTRVRDTEESTSRADRPGTNADESKSRTAARPSDESTSRAAGPADESTDGLASIVGGKGSVRRLPPGVPSPREVRQRSAPNSRPNNAGLTCPFSCPRRTPPRRGQSSPTRRHRRRRGCVGAGGEAILPALSRQIRRPW